MKKIALLLILLGGFVGHGASAQTYSICVQTQTGCISVNNNLPFPITSLPGAPLPTINVSQTISVGNNFQTAANSNTSRKSLTIANNNSNGHNCWMFIGAGFPNLTNSIILPPNTSYFRNQGIIPSDPIQVTCSGNGDSIYVDYQ